MAHGRGTCTVPDCGQEATRRCYCSKHYQRWHKYGDPEHLVKLRSGTPEQQLAFWVARRGTNECWPWQGNIDKGGYGLIHHKAAHRLAYEVWVGPVPVGLVVDHACHNRDASCAGSDTRCLHRRCCNPGHLEAVSNAENVLRGFGACADNARKTHCKHGHEFTEENTYLMPGTTWRSCRTCNKEVSRRAKGRRRRAASDKSL